MKRNKGISPLIATVLILGFTVALALIIMVWGQKFTETQKMQEEEIEEIWETSNKCMVWSGLSERREYNSDHNLSSYHNQTATLSRFDAEFIKSSAVSVCQLIDEHCGNSSGWSDFDDNSFDEVELQASCTCYPDERKFRPVNSTIYSFNSDKCIEYIKSNSLNISGGVDKK